MQLIEKCFIRNHSIGDSKNENCNRKKKYEFKRSDYVEDLGKKTEMSMNFNINLMPLQ